MHGNSWIWPMGTMVIGWLTLAAIIVAAVWLAVGTARRPADGNGSAAHPGRALRPRRVGCRGVPTQVGLIALIQRSPTRPDSHLVS